VHYFLGHSVRRLLFSGDVKRLILRLIFPEAPQDRDPDLKDYICVIFLGKIMYFNHTRTYCLSLLRSTMSAVVYRADKSKRDQTNDGLSLHYTCVTANFYPPLTEVTSWVRTG